jgi:hypothetical protein
VAARTLTLRELNRATLARQLLLERARVPVAEAVARVAGLQAQATVPPYAGLWSRLEAFAREEATALVAERSLVRATMMRHTLHLVTSGDYLRLRPAIQPALSRSFWGVARKRLEGTDLEPVLRAARKRLQKGPATFAELRALIAEIEPGADVAVLAYGVRTYLPLVQVPTGGPWGYSTTAPYALAEKLLGEPLHDSDHPRELVLRYLAAFGPATVRDVQAWSGLAGLKPAVEELKPELRIFRDEHGAELLDLPDAPLPGADAPAPVRFVPEFDNALLGFFDRTRVIAEEHRRSIFLPGGRVRAAFLVDGFVGGTWKIEKDRHAAMLVIEPFARIPRKAAAELAEEGERLVRFLHDDGRDVAVRLAQAA